MHIFQLADLAMYPIKAAPTFLLDNDQSQHKDGVRSVVKLIKHAGEWIGTRKQKGKKNELPTLDHFLFEKLEF